MFGKEKEKYPQNRWFNWQDVIKKLKSVSNGSLSDNFLEYPIGKQFVMTTCKWGGARTECRLDLPKLQGGKSARSSEKGTRCIYDDAAGPLFFYSKINAGRRKNAPAFFDFAFAAIYSLPVYMVFAQKSSTMSRINRCSAWKTYKIGRPSWCLAAARAGW